jgi:Raf kinase inhibitor-like YbhB/YbcL family protein
MKYTSYGQNISPQLAWEELPRGTISLAVLCEDPDAPSGTFVHWLAWNIRADSRAIPENGMHDGIRQGKNDFGRTGYGGPRPPPGKPHRYVFHVYALDKELSLESGAKRRDVERAMQGHVLDEATLLGKFVR